ncbi:hypothetical protein [Streptomyces marincola]|uniref:hypothetical protein n=1 Tax=Streptomyces marincola TaxID=2878388 RepID=UPI001CF19C81|nr:hypothetical protein [Streptomyces marincola]UCM87036.1 hypothetical protein LC193_03250 [Streptomyces marincola]
MAIRWDKDKVRSHAAEELARTDPDARPIVTFHATVTRERRLRGPRPLVAALRRAVRLAGRNYFIALTDRHVFVLLLGGAVRTHVVERYRVLPRGGPDPVVEEVRRGSLYNRLRLALPGEDAALHCEVVRYWRPELDRFLAEVGRAPALAAGR